MYDDLNPAPDAQTGEYSEKYKLSKLGDDNYELAVESGPLAKKYTRDHAPMWDKALEIIKDLSEKR